MQTPLPLGVTLYSSVVGAWMDAVLHIQHEDSLWWASGSGRTGAAMFYIRSTVSSQVPMGRLLPHVLVNH